VTVLTLEELKQRDLDEENHFMLTVKTRENEKDFFVTLDSSRSCRPDQKPGTGQDRGGNGFQCDVIDDRKCFCDEEGDVCCSDARNCGDNCCQECSRSDERNGDCNLCDRRGKNCMKLENGKDRGSYDCDPRRDRNCVCIKSEDFCCDLSRSCDLGECCEECDPDRDDDCQCDRDDNCVVVSGGSNGNNDKIKLNKGKAAKILLDSCLKLGGSLLEVWTPEGEKRRSSQRDDDFKDDLKDFFRTAACTKFEDEIEDYYDDRRDENFRRRTDSKSDRRSDRRRAPLRKADPFFSRSNLDSAPSLTSLSAASGKNKVAEVSQTAASLKDILATAAEITGTTQR